MSCCSIPDVLTNFPTLGSEICEPCYSELELWSLVYIQSCIFNYYSYLVRVIVCSVAVFGWVQNVSADRSSAVLQERSIDAVEGDAISLTVYFTKNGPRFLGLEVDIDISGTATGIYNACYIIMCMF